MVLSKFRLISNIGFLYPIILIGIYLSSCVAEKNDSEKGIKETMHTLPLKNEDYWDDPQSEIGDLTWNILEEGEEKLIIFSPDQIFLNHHNSWPVIMIGARDESIPYKNRFKGKTVGVCINLETGFSKIGTVHRAPDIINDEKLPPPGLIVQDYLIDIRKHLNVTWEIGTFKLWFLYYDMISNGITCKISLSEKTCDSEEEKKYLNNVMQHAQRRNMLINDAIEYKNDSDVNDKTGIVIEKEIDKKANRVVVNIRGKIPVIEHQKVSHDEQNDQLKGVFAVIPLDIIMLRTQDVREQFNLGVPCFKELTKENEQEYAEFSVGISLFDILDSEINEGEILFVYAFSGEHFSGPEIID